MVLAAALSAPLPPFHAPTGVEERMKLSVTPSAPQATFSWTDFPILQQYNPELVFEPCCDSKQEASYDSPFSSISPTHSHSSSFSSTFSADDSLISTACSEKQSSSLKRVSFAPAIQVREYAVIIGDHPSCDALPLTLDWKHSETQQRDYESKPRHATRLTFNERKNLLRTMGISEDEMAQHNHHQRYSLRHVPTSSKLA